MTMMSDLSQDLLEEILCRVPIASLGAVRSTCKWWNTLSKDRTLCKAEPKQQFLGFMTMDYRLCSMRFNLHGILNEDSLGFVDPSIKEIGVSLICRVDISIVFHCYGLLLCVTRDKSRLVLWNPYLGQTRWINTNNTREETMYALGCDKNKNHKILRYSNKQGSYEIYDLESDSWRGLNVIPNRHIEWYHQRSASVDGNTYFWTKKKYDSDEDSFLICFDFTEERFGQFLDLPFQPGWEDTMTIASVKEKKLAALFQSFDTSVIEIWITTKIEPNVVSWTLLFKADIEPLVGLDFFLCDEAGSFFIDEEMKLAVVFELADCQKQPFYIIGENGYLKKVDLGCKTMYYPLVCPYVPSSVQINQIAGHKGRENKRKRKRKSTRKGKRRELANQ